jgi:CHAT domain-containing protein/Tfp pilus assembly protein PilF
MRRRWWILGLVSLGAVALGRGLPSMSVVDLLSRSLGRGDGHLGLVRPPPRKADTALEDEQAERLIARGIDEERRGRPAAALEHFQEALRLARRAGAELSEARALDHCGYVSWNLGEIDTASTFYEQALEKWSRVGSHPGRLQTLQSFARLHLLIGEPARAIDLLREAEKIQPYQAANLHLFGMSFFLGGRDGFALQMLHRALDQTRLEGDAELEALVLADIGSVALRLGEIEQSAASFKECLQLSEERKLPRVEAYARSGLGRVLGAQGQIDEAMTELDRSAAMFRSLGEPMSLAIVLAGEALLERQRGNLDAALALSGEAVDLIEAQRLEIAGPRARAALLGVLSDPYEIQIDVLQRLSERAPRRGFEAWAFEVSEKIRARTLYEGLAGGTSRRPGTADLQRQRREVTFELRNLAREKLRLSGAPAEEARSGLERIDAGLREHLARESELWERLRRSDPRSALAGLQPLGLPQIQTLLDEETALLVYTLGRERSFVWWIERDSLTMRELPGRQEIETIAGQIQALLADTATRRQQQRMESLLAKVSELVLGPFADKLPRVRTLAVVPDGALQTLPFAALFRPDAAGRSTGEPLVASHVTVVLPSPSTLAALRQREAGRIGRPDKLIAVIADPVFEERVRLKQTKAEAQKILSLVPEGMGRAIVGLAAVPEVLSTPDLRRYRYLHFGTHGVVDAKQPELSGIILSQLTPDGRRRDGILRFYDVYGLDLPVELVSLSTCRSADGPQIRREGPITMTRSFFYAGASRVLGTLWEVSDKPAAELTAAFYEGVLRDGKTPAEALRSAQDTMRRKGWPPHNWAAFVLQGDWR